MRALIRELAADIKPKLKEKREMKIVWFTLELCLYTTIVLAVFL